MDDRTKEQQEIEMFGMTVKEVLREPIFKDKDTRGDLMYAMQILSDAQFKLEFAKNLTGNDKVVYEKIANQFINKAKFWIQEARRKV